MTTEEQKAVIGLTSGKELIATRVMLYQETKFQEVLTLRAKGYELTGGVSTGIGFWGSPEWAIGGALALGFLESMVSSSKAKEGIRLIAEARIKRDKLITQGKLFDISTIENITLPKPSEWRAPHVGKQSVKFTEMYMQDRKNFVEKHKLPESYVHNPPQGFTSIPVKIWCVALDDDFVNVEADGEIVAIRWSSVESYKLTSHENLPLTDAQLMDANNIAFDGLH